MLFRAFDIEVSPFEANVVKLQLRCMSDGSSIYALSLQPAGKLQCQVLKVFGCSGVNVFLQRPSIVGDSAEFPNFDRFIVVRLYP